MPKSQQFDESKFPGNSISSRVAPVRPESRGTNDIPDEQRRRVPRGHAIRRKYTLAENVAKIIFGDESRGIAQYIVNEVLMPTLKTMINDTITMGVEKILYGEGSGAPSRRNRRDRDTVVSYSSMYRNREDRPSRNPRRYDPKHFDLDDIFFKDGPEAMEVLDAMCDQLEKYEEVSVADYLDYAGIEGATWVDSKWGWKDLSRAFHTHTRYGYAIVLPKPIELD